MLPDDIEPYTPMCIDRHQSLTNSYTNRYDIEQYCHGKRQLNVHSVSAGDNNSNQYITTADCQHIAIQQLATTMPTESVQFHGL